MGDGWEKSGEIGSCVMLWCCRNVPLAFGSDRPWIRKLYKKKCNRTAINYMSIFFCFLLHGFAV